MEEKNYMLHESSYVDEDVEIGAPLAAAVSAEGYVYVFAEPRSEGDVPTLPELGDVL